MEKYAILGSVICLSKIDTGDYYTKFFFEFTFTALFYSVAFSVSAIISAQLNGFFKITMC